MMNLLRRFLEEEHGQDLIEYALLSTVLGFAGAATFQLIMDAMGITYGKWDNNVNAIWNTPDPAGGS